MGLLVPDSQQIHAVGRSARKYLLEDLPLHVYRCLMSAEAAPPDGFPRVKELAQWGPLQSLAPTWHGRVTPQRLKCTCPAVQLAQFVQNREGLQHLRDAVASDLKAENTARKELVRNASEVEEPFAQPPVMRPRDMLVGRVGSGKMSFASGRC